MSDLDGRIRQLLHEVADAAPPLPEGLPAPESVGSAPGPGRYHAVLVALAVVLIGVLAGLAISARQPNPLATEEPGGWSEPTSRGETTTSSVPSPTVESPAFEGGPANENSLRPLEELTAELWPVPTILPEGVGLSAATDIGPARSVLFEGSDGVSIGLMVHKTVPDSFPNPGVDQEIGGATWTWTGPLSSERIVGPVGLVVSAVGVSRSDLREVIGSLAVVDEGDLGRPVFLPFDEEGYVDVASTTVDGVEVALRAKSDGRRYATWTDYHQSTGTELPDGEAVVFSDWLVPTTPHGTDADFGVIIAIASADTARVEAVLRDGSARTAIPQDLSGGFDVGFALVVVPNATRVTINEVDRLVAYDETGTEIGQVPGSDLPLAPSDP